MMLEFSLEMCHKQRRVGRGFRFEHPLSATSWEMDPVKRIASMPEVHNSVFDMCMFGMTAKDVEDEGLVGTSTHILNSVKAIADVLSVRGEDGTGSRTQG